MLENIRIVLVQTFHPGNIGSALRAMKTMGLKNLVLVQPRCFPDSDINTMAAGAEDLIDDISLFSTLEEAVKNCTLIIGSSARRRSSTWNLPMLESAQCSTLLVQEASKNNKTALVFGRERTGLTNAELQQCNFHVTISANPDYPVLNIAAAVQILCHDIWKSYTAAIKDSKRDHQCHAPAITDTAYPTHGDMVYFYQALEKTLRDINFLVAEHQGDSMIRLKRFFNRARPETQELNMLRGILTRIQQKVPENNKDD